VRRLKGDLESSRFGAAASERLRQAEESLRTVKTKITKEEKIAKV
jgi:hypothetical protein